MVSSCIHKIAHTNHRFTLFPSMCPPVKRQKSQKFWSSEDRVKARFHYVESRQNKPKVNQKRWCSLFLLSLGKTQIYLVFLSLIRTFDLSVEGTSARKNKRKRVFLLYFARLFVPLILRILGTSARKNSNIFGFSLT